MKRRFKHDKIKYVAYLPVIGIVSKDGGDTDQVAEGHEAEDEEQEEGEAGHGGGGVTGSSRQLLDTGLRGWWCRHQIFITIRLDNIWITLLLGT